MRIFLGVAILAVTAMPSSDAQRAAPGFSRAAPAPPYATGLVRPIRGGFSGAHRGVHLGSFFYPLAYADPIYSDYLSGTGYPVASQPPVIFMQAPQAPLPAASSAASPAQPLMIELRDDRYVRVSGEDVSGTEMIDKALRSNVANRRSNDARPLAASPESPTAIIVFRDGHREEIYDYTIVDGMLYARADQYDASSNIKIELSSLNLPETVADNQSRGMSFRVPRTHNEVTVGP